MQKKIWILLAACAIFMGALPYLASVPPLKQVLIGAAEKKSGAKITIDRLRFSWLGPQKMEGVQFFTPQIDGHVTEFISDVPFWSITSMGRSIVKIDASGTTHIEGQSGEFSVQGAAPSPNAFDFTYTMSRMPTIAIDQFFNTKGLAAASIGPNFDASGSASLHNGSGGLNLDLSSPNGTAVIRALFTPDAITLREPLFLTLHLTPELTRNLTKNFSKGALLVQSLDPARLRIEAKNFHLPLPFSPSTLQIGQGFLDLGRIRILNAEFLVPLSKFLKARFSTNQVDAWFNAADFKLRDGLLELSRTDALLANSFHICGWGSADLVKEQLDMILGIPADTLSKSLGIKNVSSNYVLQIPVTGTFHSPQFDTGSATAKIAALIAAGQIQKQKGIIGGVATIIGQAAEEKAPPPKKPFPWGK